MLDSMNGNRILRTGQLLLKVGGIAIGLIFALITTFRDLIVASDLPTQKGLTSLFALPLSMLL